MNNLLSTSLSEVFGYIGYGLIAILVLLIMITVHEFGHYIVGKIFHFGIDEFSIGFGPKLFSKKKKDGEIFSIRLLPLGGYCAFRGEDEDTSQNKELKNQDTSSYFNNKKPYQRILVLIAGAFMNYLLAILLIMAMFFSFGQNAFKVNQLIEGYSEEYSFQLDDVIIKANNKRVYLTTDIMSAISDKKQGDVVNFVVRRNNQDLIVDIKLKKDTNFENIEDTNTLLESLGIHELATTFVKFGFFKTIGNSFQYSLRLAGTIFTVFHQLFSGKIGIDAMGGTVTTISVTTMAIKNGGLKFLLYIASFIGVNLAVFNLLPIPALDGSRVIFCLIEWIRKKPVNRKIESIVHTIGFTLLILFAILLDVRQCF